MIYKDTGEKLQNNITNLGRNGINGCEGGVYKVKVHLESCLKKITVRVVIQVIIKKALKNVRKSRNLLVCFGNNLENSNEKIKDVKVKGDTCTDVVFWAESIHNHVKINDKENTEKAGSEDVDHEVDCWGHEENLEDSGPEKNTEEGSHTSISNGEVPLVLEGVCEQGCNDESSDDSSFQNNLSIEKGDNATHSKSLNGSESNEKHVVQWNLSGVDMKSDDQSDGSNQVGEDDPCVLLEKLVGIRDVVDGSTDSDGEDELETDNSENLSEESNSNHPVGFSDASRKNSVRIDDSGFSMCGTRQVHWPHLWVSLHVNLIIAVAVVVVGEQIDPFWLTKMTAGGGHA